MSAKKKATPIAIGLRAERGGAVVIGVAIEGSEPRVVLSYFLATAAEGDRLALEPYHVAAEMGRGTKGAVTAAISEAVAEGRKRQDKLAAKALKDLLGKLRKEGYEPGVTALLINRAGWVKDLLAYSLAFADHPPVAEGLAVRDALRFACGKAELDIAEMDEKSLPELASEVLRLGSAELEAKLKELGAEVGPPWRKEQKAACLEAWVALAQLRRGKAAKV
jgi:hypothetical protein